MMGSTQSRKLLELMLPRAELSASSWRTPTAGCGVVALLVLRATDADPRFRVERPPSMLTAAIPVYTMKIIVLRFQHDPAGARNASTTRDCGTCPRWRHRRRRSVAVHVPQASY